MRAAHPLALCGLLLAGAPAAALAPPVPGPPESRSTALEWQAWRVFGSAEGLPQNSVLALLQDAQGFVYAGTQQGLARYDGHRWQPVELPTGGRAHAVGALAQAADGALWVGTDVVGAWRIDGDDARPVGGSELAPVTALLADGDGVVWVGTMDALLRCRGVDCTAVDAVAGLGARSLLREHVDGEAQLWVGTGSAGVLRLRALDAAQPERVPWALTRADGLPNNVGLALARFAGDLWIGTGRGLARYDGRRLTVYSTPNGFPMAMVFALLPYVDDGGTLRLLASLRPGGLAEIDADGQWRLIDSHRGLPASAAHSLLRERHRGQRWIGTMSAGIARSEADRWALFDERMGLPDRSVLGVGWSSAEAALWVGTAGGAVIWRDGGFVPLLPDAHAGQLVHDLVDAPDGSRWIAHGRGLQRWRGDRLDADWTVDNSALPAVASDRVALRRRGDGSYEIFAATGHGLARWRPESGLQRVDDLPGWPVEGSVRSLLARADPTRPGSDRVDLAGSEGVWRIDDGGGRRLAIDCVDPRGLFALAAEGEAGGLWLSTRDGLLRWREDGRCERWPSATALGALTHVRRVGDWLYAFGARGALRLDPRGAPDQTGTLLGHASGLASPEISASTSDPEGRLFAATATGLAALKPPRVDAAPPSPAPLRLLLARHGDDDRPLAAGALLPPGQSSVRFEFALLAFDREHAVRYRTRLHGLQGQFGEWQAEPRVAYPRLPPGSYRLEVEARDADGIASPPLGFAFAVAAPWWQRPWALAAGALLPLALGLAIGRWRARAARLRAAVLEAEVAARTRELADANARLEVAAVTDPLTGLRNRRFFSLAAPAEAERARRGGPRAALLVVLLDIDHFKHINDEHGHDAGDAVLVEVARRLRATARGGDLLVRWGGEEFLLLLRDADADGADGLLERLMTALAGTPVALSGERLMVSGSIGAVRFPPDPEAPRSWTLDQAIALADEALYRAKREGRDRAVRVRPVGTDGREWRTVPRPPPG